MLQNGIVTWKKNATQKMKTSKYNRKTMELFYGVTDLDQNLVWKPMDDDPSLFLNFNEKISNLNKVTHILTRY